METHIAAKHQFSPTGVLCHSALQPLVTKNVQWPPQAISEWDDTNCRSHSYMTAGLWSFNRHLFNTTHVSMSILTALWHLTMCSAQSCKKYSPLYHTNNDTKHGTNRRAVTNSIIEQQKSESCLNYKSRQTEEYTAPFHRCWTRLVSSKYEL